MPRKRKRARTFNAAPLLIAALLAAIVVWGVLPSAHSSNVPSRRVTTVAAVPRTSPSSPPQGTQTASPAPEATAQPSPAASPAAASPASSGAHLAVIIDDCGQWLDTERGYLALPIPLTLSVLPHVPYARTIAQEAAGGGKDVMLHLPMEPLSHVNAGSGEIRVAMSDEAIASQTEDDLAQVPMAKGVNNHEGSAASADVRVMKDVIAVIKSHGLFFVDSRTNAETVGAQEAQQAGVPTASRDVFLDNRADVAYSEAMLQRAADIAKRNGNAIAIGHPKPTTLQALREMYPRLEAQGITFVPVADLVH